DLSGCSVGLAASNGTCSFNSGCAFAVSDVTPPPTAFSDGEVARLEVDCSQAGDGTLCIDNTAAASAGFGPVFACPVEQCATYQCSACLPGDSNTSVGVDAGDPIAAVHCVLGDADALFDCTCGADCNCQNGTEIADVICAVKRLI